MAYSVNLCQIDEGDCGQPKAFSPERSRQQDYLPTGRAFYLVGGQYTPFWPENHGNQFRQQAIGVQQKLMRHAQVSTTMKYGNAYMTEKRKAHGAVVQMVLPARNNEKAEAMGASA